MSALLGMVKFSDFISCLALMISSGALALEIRRWFDSSPRLRLSLLADAVEFPSGDGKPKLALTVTNRGAEATTLTHMVCIAYNSPWKKFRKKSTLAGIVKDAPIPAELKPNTYWMGIMPYDDKTTAFRQKGQLYIGVFAAHRDRKYLLRVPPAKPIKTLLEKD